MLLFEIFTESSSDPAYYRVLKAGNRYNLEVTDSSNGSLPSFSKDGLSSEDLDSLVSELKTNFPDIEDLSDDSPMQENIVIPDHGALDFVTDVTQNQTEILAQYHSVGGDIDLTLSKLQRFNPSWRMIVKKYGRDRAKQMILKHVKS